MTCATSGAISGAFTVLTDGSLDKKRDSDLLDAGEGLVRGIFYVTPGSEITGLYFDRFNANLVYLNIHHTNDGVDRLIQVPDVSAPATYAMFLAGFVACRKLA